MPSSYPTTLINRDQITISPSAVFELTLALGSVHFRPYRLRAWVDRARAALGPDLVADVDYFNSDCFWLSLGELPVDYTGDPFNVNQFIDYVAGLSVDDFLFYLWGRVIPRDEIAVARQDPAQALQRLAQFYKSIDEDRAAEYATDVEGFNDILRDPAKTQQRALNLLRQFNELVFKAEAPQLRQYWLTSVAEQQALLDRTDPETFIENLFGNRPVPKMFPEGYPLRAIHVTPSWFLWKSTYRIWGYGSLYLFFDAGQSEAKPSQSDQNLNQLAKLTSALSDPTRLRILRSIIQDDEVYGHKLSRLHKISQPAVSRHMGILKDAGLVSEEPRDGKILYRINREPVANLSASLLRFLED